MRWRTSKPCADCPFNKSGPGLALRRSLRRKRWLDILADLRGGKHFHCHNVEPGARRRQASGRVRQGGRQMSYEFAGEVLPDVRTDTLAESIARRFPSVWRRCYTKHYDGPGVYRSFKAVAVQFAMGLIGDALERHNKREAVTNLPVLFTLLEEYDWPNDKESEIC